MKKLALTLSVLVAASAHAEAFRRFVRTNRANVSTAVLRVLQSSPSTAEQCTGSLTNIATTRSSSAYCTKDDGTLVYLGNNTTRVEANGILVEPAATNLMLRSEELDNGSWTKGNTFIVAIDITSPAADATAETIEEDTNNTTHIVSQGYTATNAAWTCSVFAKANTRSWVWMSPDGSSKSWFNISTGTTGTSAAGNTAAITPLGSSGWYRVSVTRTMSAGATTLQFGLATADNTSTYVGASNSVHAWGLQCEAGTVATSYVPTAGTTATRSADAVSSSLVALNDTNQTGSAAATVHIRSAAATPFVLSGQASNVLAFVSTAATTISMFTVANTSITVPSVLNRDVHIRAEWVKSSSTLLQSVTDGVSNTGAHSGADWFNGVLYLGNGSSGANQINGWTTNICVGKTAGACQ